MNKFEQLGVDSNLVKGLNELNIFEPTEIQSEVIPLLLNNKIDLVGQAQTGTGKTAAYGLPLLEQVDADTPAVQALILCPTRELSQQISKQLFKFVKYYHRIFTVPVYGGSPIDRQIAALTRPTQIVVATPGRLIDLVKRKAVDISQVKTIVLDEADEMLSMGFKDELDQILGYLTTARNKWLFSATMPEGITQIVNQHMSRTAHRIKIDGKNVVNKQIEHQYQICDEADKFNKLLLFLKTQADNRGMVFCRTKSAAQKLALQLVAKNIAADAIHGDLFQKDRDKVMRAFKKGTLQLLVATDIAARGIDIAALSFVLHYQLPDQDEYYTHRSGRTARAGKTGISLCFINSPEYEKLKRYEKKLNISFKQVK